MPAWGLSCTEKMSSACLTRRHSHRFWHPGIPDSGAESLGLKLAKPRGLSSNGICLPKSKEMSVAGQSGGGSRGGSREDDPRTQTTRSSASSSSRRPTSAGAAEGATGMLTYVTLSPVGARFRRGWTGISWIRGGRSSADGVEPMVRLPV